MCFCSFSGTSTSLFLESRICPPKYSKNFDKNLQTNNVLQVTELPFFATKVRIGRNGAEEIYQLGPLNEYERYGLVFSP